MPERHSELKEGYSSPAVEQGGHFFCLCPLLLLVLVVILERLTAAQILLRSPPTRVLKTGTKFVNFAHPDLSRVPTRT